ncbi:MAG: hypothetical protein WDO73_19440 [Ignavibacteriota bacterium]
MTITSFLLVIATSFPGLAFSQDADKTFYFTRPASNADMTALVTSARTMLALQDISIDQEQQALVTHGPVEKLVALDWLFHQLDPAAANRSSAPAEYKFSDDVISVIPLSPDATVADITAVTTAIRTVGDIIRLVPLITQKVTGGARHAEKIAAARWMVGQLLPHDGQAPKVDSAPYPSPIVDKNIGSCESSHPYLSDGSQDHSRGTHLNHNGNPHNRGLAAPVSIRIRKSGDREWPAREDRGGGLVGERTGESAGYRLHTSNKPCRALRMER